MLIVGIDPGTTLGYAFFDLSGKLAHVGSARGSDREKLVRRIREFGKPVLFATDVSPPPEFVVKVAAVFNSRVFEPSRNLSEREKVLLSKGLAFENLHERDAIASAIKAYHRHQNKFRQIEAALKSKKIEGMEEQVKGMVLDGFSLNQAIMDIEAEEEIEEAKSPEPSLPQPADILKKNERIRALLHSNTELRKAIERLETDKRILQEKMLDLEKGIYGRVMRDKELRKRDARIRILTRKKRKKHKGKRQSALKALGAKEDKKVDINSLIRQYRQKSLNR